MIRECSKRLVRMAIIGASLGALVSCSLSDSTQPEGDTSFIESNWGIEAPESAATVEYYSTDSDFQGGREDVYVISMEESDRSGYWNDSGYTLDSSEVARREISPQSISESSGAELDEVFFESLKCREPEERDQNYIVSCFNPTDGNFYVFEEIF
ncbi:hypothetical protein [Brachybacterium alimentarium]|uniref:hypothetical protein n=1 Tax=Brachybacterium alimentarium TaxID=47845 RepID=UPI003FCFFF82